MTSNNMVASKLHCKELKKMNPNSVFTFQKQDKLPQIPQYHWSAKNMSLSFGQPSSSDTFN